MESTLQPGSQLLARRDESGSGSPSLRPTPVSERIHALDAMRGLAISGVLLAYTIWNLGGPPEEEWSRLDRAVVTGMDLFVDGKCLSMFAILFGLGVSQQWKRWEGAGCDPRPLHARRMLFLLVVGLLHAVLLRNGDILAPYALLGLVLMAFRHASSRAVVALLPFLVLLPYLLEPLLMAAGVRFPDRPVSSGQSYLLENLSWLGYWYATNPIRGWPQFLFLMLVGLLLGRGRVLEQLLTSRRTSWVLAGALTAACLTRVALERVGTAGAAPPWFLRDGRDLLYQLNAWFLAVTYGLGLVLLVRRFPNALRPLRAMGRMAFTNYLVPAILIVPMCLVFDLFDTISPSRGLWMGLGFGALLMVASTLWLRHHALGPFERMWRGFTYRKRLALVAPGSSPLLATATALLMSAAALAGSPPSRPEAERTTEASPTGSSSIAR